MKDICGKLGFHRPNVEKIIKQFNENGLKIFKRGKSPGKPRRITKEQRALIFQYLNTGPEKLGLHYNNWSIKQDEIKYKKKTPWLYSNDPDFAKKN